jgi:hypothetical protein
MAKRCDHAHRSLRLRDGLGRMNEYVIQNRCVRVAAGIQSAEIIDEYFRHFFRHVIEGAAVDCPAQSAPKAGI